MVPTELWCLLAPPNFDSILVLAMKDFGTTIFMGSPVLADVPTQFFNGIWACMPFPHLGSVLCCCPYKERIVCQTIIARTPSHWSVDDCCLALPPRLWQPRNPEGGEATVIEGSLTFPHSVECHSWMQFYVIPRTNTLQWHWTGLHHLLVPAVQQWHNPDWKLCYIAS